ncbi:MAG TPA: cytochrome b/b6 domain-containing protein [Rhodanobacteraceae bacterium]|nr:cytochrome b/b6 domain-containing protein [Rhodanobacteraceae bacterium]
MQDSAESEGGIRPPPRIRDRVRVIYRHRLPVRVMHWINAICLLVLLGSGLQIFNAHPALYWGQKSTFDKPLLAMGAQRMPDGALRGVTQIGSHDFTTTGVFGASSMNGHPVARGFPAWLTIPGPQWLSMGRRWHFFFAWLFVINGICFAAYTLIGRHFRRDLLPTRTDWRGIGRSIIDHALLRHPQGEAAARYNVLQKLTYLIVIFGFGPLIVLMGLAMSPRMDSVLGWLVTLVGGRQSARTIHFILAWGFVAFFLIHIFEVLVSGLGNELRSIITGRYAIHENIPDRSSDDGH